MLESLEFEYLTMLLLMSEGLSGSEFVLVPLMPIPAPIELDLLSLIPLISIEAQALRHSSRVKICRINFILPGLIWV